VIIAIGDVHGHYDRLRALIARLLARYGPHLTILQVGDLGWWPDDVLRKERKHFVAPGFPVRWVPGNHEHWGLLGDHDGPTELEPISRPELIYLPKGTVLTLEGLSIGFLGGADSIDKGRRIEGLEWFREEAVTYRDILRFADVPSVDLLVTHTPPLGLMRHLWDVQGDGSAQAVGQLWDGLGRPPLVCGHMHDTIAVRGFLCLGELDAAIFTHEREWVLVPREIVGPGAEIARARFSATL
jgi:hypothetical protein